ncbi:MAG TPA: diacylglycerol kinase family protein [Opitutaceae bacterium]|nr:diacylglycerol kinase family protein [Opitutaceae bacterium]
MKVALVHNPSAGKSDSSTGDLISLLARAGHQAVSVDLCDDLVGHPKIQGVDLVAVAGGDGTVRKVALQFAHRPQLLTLLPIGTANNVAKSLGIAGKPEEVIAHWNKARRTGIDLGLVQGPWGRRLFLEGIGLGLVGRSIAIIEEIDELSSREFKDPEDKLQRDLAVFLALAHELPTTRIGCQIDGQDRTNDFLLLEILNIRHAGPRIELASRARPDDGQLNVVMVTAHDRPELKEALKKVFTDFQHRHLLRSQIARTARLELTCGELRIDDEVVLDSGKIQQISKDRPVVVEISIQPGALQMLLPHTQSLDAPDLSEKT